MVANGTRTNLKNFGLILVFSLKEVNQRHDHPLRSNHMDFSKQNESNLES